MRISKPIPARYRDHFVEVAVAVPPIIETLAGPRSAVGYRWKCNKCGAILKEYTAGAQAHIAKHVREAERDR